MAGESFVLHSTGMFSFSSEITEFNNDDKHDKFNYHTLRVKSEVTRQSAVQEEYNASSSKQKLQGPEPNSMDQLLMDIAIKQIEHDQDRNTAIDDIEETRENGLSVAEYREICCFLRTNRNMKRRCSHTDVDKKSDRSYMCGVFSEDDRKKSFDEFWGFKTWIEKRAYVTGLVITRQVFKRRNARQSDSNRKGEGHDIHLKHWDKGMMKVCRAFFINTLALGEDTFKRWVKRKNEDGTPVESKKKKKDEADTVKALRIKHIHTWIENLPKLTNYFNQSNKVYVDSNFRSYLNMYKLYKDWCLKLGYKSCGRTVFVKMLKDSNIEIFFSKKDSL